ncbi:MAG: altronate dehydratase small subunit [Clostridia bacterium]|nr:altronate dehydratase small subunit [Clostridia bacterium]
MRQAIVLNAQDNVATAVANLEKDTVANVAFPGGTNAEVVIVENIPYGHKFALREIKAGEAVIKYGEVIGLAMADIPAGAHVHIHNIESQRGRGDKQAI